MKKSMVVLTTVVLLAAVLLTGCQDIFSTSERDVPKKGGLVMDGTINRWTEAETTGGSMAQTQPTVPTTEGYRYGMGTIMASDLNIRSGPGTGFASAGTGSRGDRVGIVQVVYSEDVPWGCFEDGWVCMDYVVMDDPSLLPLEDTDLKNALTLSAPTGVYAGPNTYYSAGSTYSRYASIEITGKAGQWYRTDKGWVKAEDVYIYGTATKDPSVKVTVIPKDLNLRTHPNTTSKVIRTLKQNETLEIFIQVEINGKRWGCTKDGWVSMDYVQEDGSGAVVGTWYYFEMDCWSATEFLVYEYNFSKDNVFTYKKYTYNIASGAMSAAETMKQCKYTCEKDKISLSDASHPSKVTLKGDTMESPVARSGEGRFVRGTVNDAKSEITKIMNKAKQNAQNNDSSIVGDWLVISYNKENQIIEVHGGYTFYANGTYVGGTAAEAVGTYNPETGNISWMGSGSDSAAGIYTFDGDTVTFECWGAEHYAYEDYQTTKTAAKVSDGVLTIYGENGYQGTQEEIIAMLIAQAAE